MAKARITFDSTPWRDSTAGRIAEWNERAHKRSMAATLRWADKLANEGRTRLPNANWWHGEPYGTKPQSTAAWATKLAKKHPAKVRYTPGEQNMKLELVKLGAIIVTEEEWTSRHGAKITAQTAPSRARTIRRPSEWALTSG